MKIQWINGLKGICCVTVVLLHLTASFFPEIMMCSQEIIKLGMKNIVSLTPLNIFINGSFAVYIFWTLSAFLTAYSWYKKYDIEDIKRKILNKYFKHIFLFLFCSTVVLLTIRGGGYFYGAAGEISENSYFVNERDFSQMTVKHLFNDILYGIFFTGQVYLIPPLWTMKIEFWGTILTSLLLILFGKNKYRNSIWLFLTIIFIRMGVPYICFLIGIKFADDMVHIKIKKRKMQGIFILFLGLFAGGYPPSGVPHSGIYSYVYTGFIENYNQILTTKTGTHILYVVAAACVLYGIYKSDFIIRFLENKLFLFLGERSLYIYLVHAPIIFSLTAFSFAKVYYWSKNYLASVLFACFVTFVASLIFAELVRLVNRKYLEPLSKKIVSILCLREQT